MSITSLSFLLLLAGTFLLYFLLPKKMQWIVLLVASMVFYLVGGYKTVIYVLITASSVYGAALWMKALNDKRLAYVGEHKDSLSKEDKKALKTACQKKRKAVMVLTVLLNIGILCVFKYFHFALEQVNAVCGLFGSSGIQDTFSLIVPLGISFYTFQSVGYLADVYWEHYDPETNYFRMLLFVSFFPQMTQGPISDYQVLTRELFTEHEFTYTNFSHGAWRFLWGLAKKLIIADILSDYVANTFAHYTEYAGIAVFLGAICYSIQIYADFSGYMDIMCGYCEMLGIRLTENFNLPYFSRSIAEYWRRWHISLGEWFKKYIYYPIGMSNWSRSFAKNTKKKFGKHFADTVPATVALLVTWLATGLWHGASWAYVAWGLVNGLFIILSLWMEPVYAKIRDKLKMTDDSAGWNVFRIVRTFILVTFIKVLPEVGTLRDGFGLIKQVFTSRVVPHSVWDFLPFVSGRTELVVVFLFTVVLFVFSVIQCKKTVRSVFEKIPIGFRLVILALLVTAIGIWGDLASTEGFMYANF